VPPLASLYLLMFTRTQLGKQFFIYATAWRTGPNRRPLPTPPSVPAKLPPASSAWAGSCWRGSGAGAGRSQKEAESAPSLCRHHSPGTRHPSAPLGGPSGAPRGPLGGPSAAPRRPLGGPSAAPRRPLGGPSAPLGLAMVWHWPDALGCGGRRRVNGGGSRFRTKDQLGGTEGRRKAATEGRLGGTEGRLGALSHHQWGQPRRGGSVLSRTTSGV
jgi:hypothetical protein